MEVESLVTIVAAQTGLSETLPVSLGKTTVKELSEWCNALLGLGDGPVFLYKDGNRLPPEMILEQAGVRNGDLLAAQQLPAAPASTESSSSGPGAGLASTVPSTADGGGSRGDLDFSNLLQSATAVAARGSSAFGGDGSGGDGGLDFSNLLMGQQNNSAPVYFPGMTLNEALEHNTNPEHIVSLLQTKEHLFKELNHHQPILASKLRGQKYDKAVQIWREELMKGGIQQAINRNNTLQQEHEMRRRLQLNPNDPEAKEYFESIKRREKVQEQYFQMMQEYPESMGKILMLYIEAKVNGHSVHAFVDSGAQTTIMSKKLATLCGLMDLLDTRFRGVAVGVGTGTILGRIHIANLQLQDYHFPVTLTIMDDPPPGSEAKEMPFLLGLDMLKRHTCSIDLENQCLKFRLGPGKYLETPFLHEKDLTEAQGGTKGFDAEKANQEVEELLRKSEKADGDKKESDNN